MILLFYLPIAGISDATLYQSKSHFFRKSLTEDSVTGQNFLSLKVHVLNPRKPL
jgi:hypothetical protein